MTYQSDEISVASGHPIELYDIYTSDNEHYCYHTAGEDYGTITYLGRDYEFGIVERAEFSIGKMSDSNFLEIGLSKGNVFAVQYVNSALDVICSLNVYRQHSDNYITYWSGNLISVSFDENSVPTLRFQSIICNSIRMGHRRGNMRMCPHILYGTWCNVNQENYKVEGTITNISGLVITSSVFATKSDGWFQGGKIKIGTAWRLIKAHTTNTVTIDRIFVDAEIGNEYVAYAGCGHTGTICKNKFNNKLNFGGNEFLPSINPMNSHIGRQNG